MTIYAPRSERLYQQGRAISSAFGKREGERDSQTEKLQPLGMQRGTFMVLQSLALSVVLAGTEGNNKINNGDDFSMNNILLRIFYRQPKPENMECIVCGQKTMLVINNRYLATTRMRCCWRHGKPPVCPNHIGELKLKGSLCIAKYVENCLQHRRLDKLEEDTAILDRYVNFLKRE